MQNSKNEDGFQVFRKQGACNAAGAWPLVPIATTAHNVVAYTDTDLESGIYSYRVRAYIESDARPYAYGYSGYSNCYDVVVPWPRHQSKGTHLC